MTVVAVVKLGQLKWGGGEGHMHLVEFLGPDDLVYHRASEKVSD